MKMLIALGSLRTASFSRKLANAATAAAPAGVECEIVDGRALPHYDQDLDGEDKPEAVRELHVLLAGADALVFITPEYNYGIPGVLKNWIDWASRPAFKSPLRGMPSLVMSLSPAPTGGARAHAQLTTVLSGTLTPVFVAPSYVVPAVHEKFGESGELTDEVTRTRLEKTLENFRDWAESIAPSA